MSEAFSISMPHWPPPRWQHEPAVGFTRMQRILAVLGNPHHMLPPVVHIAGTNGKGSTIAFLRAMLEAASYRVHAYTSPHLQHFEERITLASRPIEATELYQYLEETRIAAGDEIPQFFEGTTIAALLAFSRTAADILLVETGMGGRFDPTNIIPQKILTIITSISYDHMEFLGKNLQEIAWHKAGIMRSSVPCIVARQSPEVMQVIEDQAAEIGAPLYMEGQHWACAREPDGTLYFEDAHGGGCLPAPVLVGVHQYHNAGLAIAAMSALTQFDVEATHVERGLQKAHWPGRLMRLLAPDAACEWWYDGGHNIGGARVIVKHAHTQWLDKPLYIIFGTTQGKAIDGIIKMLAPVADGMWVVPVRAEPKSYSANQLSQQASACGVSVQVADHVEDALMQIAAMQTRPYRVLLFGSLYFYPEIKEFIPHVA